MSTVLGLIGVGRIGAMHAANLVAVRNGDDAHPPVDLDIVLADVAVDRAQALADALGVRAAGSVDQVFDERPDGVLIAVGTAQHAPLILRALEAGIPVFCEKPVASTVAEALPVLEAAERTGVPVHIGHQRRLDPGHLEARRAFRAGELGWLHTVRAITADQAPPPVAFLATSGGLFRDCSVHDFDTLRWITGREIVEVDARGSNNGDPEIGKVGDVDTAVALVTFDDGLVGTVSATRYNGAGHDVRLELQGSAGTVQVGLDEHYAGRSAEPGVNFPDGTPWLTFHERFAEAYVAEMRAFVEMVHGERTSPCTPADSVAASRVADAAQESLTTGAPVRVDLG
ncbi:Gfo/Idh/MocA family oxidoreductase [Kocuria sp. JC486]|uniref:Gfo/Idh/MocA family protein n=1 Tax=Kocuria sp. JC486 TaxID=1970736 RepID=UPI001421E3FE|nr:Gfo/Idh/MocA family oxidoreductase [Kocuria sp. JC486]NHU85946.1 Gfo/Idh/MocA family oxidoreductase [Kocuria sp. JC486]